jgi:hypothetical protein
LITIFRLPVGIQDANPYLLLDDISTERFFG